MKNRTRWKRVRGLNILNKRFFDCGEYTLGFFTVLKAWRCKVYCRSALTPNGSHWFSKAKLLVKTDDGLKFIVPFIPWAKSITSADGQKKWSEFYDEQPWY